MKCPNFNVKWLKKKIECSKNDKKKIKYDFLVVFAYIKKVCKLFDLVNTCIAYILQHVDTNKLL